MQKGDVVFGGLVPTDQDAPEAVQPAVGALHHPAPGFEPSLPLDGLCLLASTTNVSGEAELLQRAAHLVKVIAPVSSTGQAFVQAPALGLVRSGRRSGHGQTFHRGPYQLHVMTVGAVHRQTHRNALSFGQQAALDPAFTSVSGIGAGFFPRPRVIWSWLRPCSPNSSPAPSVRHSVPVPPATAPGTLQRQPIPESAGGRWTQSRCPWRPAPSTDRRCAARRRCHWRRCGREPGEAAAKPMGVHMLGDQRFQYFPKLVGDLETAGGGIGLGGWASTLGTGWFGVFRFRHYPSLDATLTWIPAMRLQVATSF